MNIICVAFSMEADIPDYDMDSEDEQWVTSQSKLELNADKVKYEYE
jgi:hypothetical protein